MLILYKEKTAALVESSTSSEPIVTALTHLSHEDQVALRKKLDIAFVLAKEKLSFRRFPTICELEERRGAYKTAKAAKSFTHFIA